MQCGPHAARHTQCKCTHRFTASAVVSSPVAFCTRDDPMKSQMYSPRTYPTLSPSVWHEQRANGVSVLRTRTEHVHTQARLATWRHGTQPLRHPANADGRPCYTQHGCYRQHPSSRAYVCEGGRHEGLRAGMCPTVATGQPRPHAHTFLLQVARGCYPCAQGRGQHANTRSTHGLLCVQAVCVCPAVHGSAVCSAHCPAIATMTEQHTGCQSLITRAQCVLVLVLVPPDAALTTRTYICSCPCPPSCLLAQSVAAQVVGVRVQTRAKKKSARKR